MIDISSLDVIKVTPPEQSWPVFISQTIDCGDDGALEVVIKSLPVPQGTKLGLLICKSRTWAFPSLPLFT